LERRDASPRIFIKGQPPKKEEVIRIIMLVRPELEQTDIDKWEWVEPGEFEWSYLGDKFIVDKDDLMKELAKTPFNRIANEVYDRVCCFNKVFLLIPTLEVVSALVPNP
jgi:hypothetical protein